MTFARRLATLEESFSPREAVLRWLAEVRAFPSLSSYVAWLIDQPSDAWPLVAIPAQLERGVRGSMRGRARPDLERAIGRAVTQALFLIELVLLANTRVAALTRELACGILTGAGADTVDRGRALDAALDRLGATYFGDSESILLEDVARDWRAVLDGLAADGGEDVHPVPLPIVGAAFDALVLTARATTLGLVGDAERARTLARRAFLATGSRQDE